MRDRQARTPHLIAELVRPEPATHTEFDLATFALARQTSGASIALPPLPELTKEIQAFRITTIGSSTQTGKAIIELPDDRRITVHALRDETTGKFPLSGAADGRVARFEVSPGGDLAWKNPAVFQSDVDTASEFLNKIRDAMKHRVSEYSSGNLTRRFLDELFAPASLGRPANAIEIVDLNRILARNLIATPDPLTDSMTMPIRGESGDLAYPVINIFPEINDFEFTIEFSAMPATDEELTSLEFPNHQLYLRECSSVGVLIPGGHEISAHAASGGFATFDKVQPLKHYRLQIEPIPVSARHA